MGFSTLEAVATVRGIGLHSGADLTLHLLPSDQEGIEFARVDLPDAPVVRASWENVTGTTHATTLQTGEARVSTVEHLLAALWALGVTHCRAEVNGPEVPILDGSAAGWVEAIARAGVRDLGGQRAVWKLERPVWWEGGGATVFGVPDAKFRLSVAVDYDHPQAHFQTYDGVVSAPAFAADLAPARTFTLEAWVEALRGAGLIRGGSEDNAIVLRADGSAGAQRFPNELARHKALDVVGDLALLFGSASFQGHIFALKAGHGAHRDWIEKCQQEGALRLVAGLERAGARV